jgi:hypothetical protein
LRGKGFLRYLGDVSDTEGDRLRAGAGAGAQNRPKNEFLFLPLAKIRANRLTLLKKSDRI